MRAYWATVLKELLLLARDRYGLAVLFVMPAVLVVVVALVQENVLKATGETGVDILFVDLDQQEFGKAVREKLQASGSARLVTGLDGQEIGPAQARALIEKGRYQACIVVPEGITAAVRRLAAAQVSAAFSPPFGGAAEEAPPTVSIHFDPLVHGTFRSSMLNALRLMLLAMEIEIKARVLAEALPALSGGAAGAAGQGMAARMDSGWASRRLVDVLAEQSRFKKLPTSVEHNVPAWAVFGIFFIVLPLGGTILRERQDGTLDRLRTMPVPHLTLLAGKLAAYVIVCWGQFLFVVLVGKTLLPLLGTPVLGLGSDPLALIVAVTLVALAACGYGVMIGTLARTFEQATVIGPVSVVCAAAIGGVMVPVYAMPPAMQTLSQFSPLAWGLNALVEIVAREATLGSIAPELGYLAAFSAATLLIARAAFGRMDR
jgi:ABC-2 type transport system permease protein